MSVRRCVRASAMRFERTPVVSRHESVGPPGARARFNLINAAASVHMRHDTLRLSHVAAVVVAPKDLRPACVLFVLFVILNLVLIFITCYCPIYAEYS